MDMGQSPSPGSMGGMMHSGQSENMMMSMQMYFTATSSVTLWFQKWSTNTQGKYAASIVGLLLLCILQEAVSRFRTHAARQWGSSGFRSLQSSSADVVHSDAQSSIASFRKYLPVRVGLSLLYALNLTTSYLLMLAIMTFNVGYFIAIVAGLGLGHFIFFPSLQSSGSSPGMLSEACCPQP